MDLPTKREKLAVEIPAEVADMFNLSANMEGVIPRLPQIKIIHRGQLFEMPDETKIGETEGIIIDQHPANAWWIKKMVPGEPPASPDCFSLDGITPEDGENRQSDKCANCPKNEYGSDRDGGKGKDCKNMKRLHILMQDSLLPRRLTVPPTSISSFESYMTSLVDRGLPYAVVVTKFSLLKKESGSFEYAEVKFHRERVLTQEEMVFVASSIKQYKDEARKQTIDSEEYVSSEDASFDTDSFEEKPDIPY